MSSWVVATGHLLTISTKDKIHKQLALSAPTASLPSLFLSQSQRAQPEAFGWQELTVAIWGIYPWTGNHWRHLLPKTATGCGAPRGPKLNLAQPDSSSSLCWAAVWGGGRGCDKTPVRFSQMPVLEPALIKEERLDHLSADLIVSFRYRWSEP